jgi:hypothetical protein
LWSVKPANLIEHGRGAIVWTAQLASNLPKQSFQAIRESLLPLLNDADDAVRFHALRCFCQQEDLAAGPLILEVLRQPQLAEQYKVTVMQGMRELTGSTFNYRLHQWGPGTANNRKAIEKFETWLEERVRED